MLDIYFAPPSMTSVPADPGHLEFAGSIDLDAHRSLAMLFEKSRQAGADLQYFQDSILKPEQIAILLQTFMVNVSGVEGSRQMPPAFDVIRRLLGRAADRGMGLVAFSD
mgnify:CR=1 FL=1